MIHLISLPSKSPEKRAGVVPGGLFSPLMPEEEMMFHCCLMRADPGEHA